MANEILNSRTAATSIAKKQKTGGRVKKSLEQLLVETRIRNELADIHDDTNIPEELAAIYLCISVSELASYRKPVKSEKPGTGKETKKVTDKSGVNASPPRLKMIKLIRQGAVGQNQKTMYKMGHLREFRDLNVVESSFEAAVKAGLFGYVTIQTPFFIEPSKHSDRGRPILIGNAWDQTHPSWAVRFKELFHRKLAVVWMTNAEAARCLWKNLGHHRFIARAYIELLNSEASQVQSVIEVADSILEELKPSREAESAKQKIEAMTLSQRQ